MKNVLFLSGLFPEEIRDEIVENSKSNTQFAADALQWSFIKGLVCYYSNLHVLNFPFLGSYPTLYKTPFIKTFSFGKPQGFDGLNVGYFNLIALKNIFIYKKAKKNIIAWAGRNHGEKVVLIYSAFLPFLKAAMASKKEFSDLKVILILPDLPQFMGGPNNVLYKLFNHYTNNELQECFKQVDGYIFLSKYMAEKTPVINKPWTVVEGIFNNETNNSSHKNITGGKKTILYTGTLAKRYGILGLLEAFKLIKNENYQLVICGDGDTKDDIIFAAQTDKRIIYKGSIDRAEVLQMQREASLLVNPRTPEGEFTKFSFPSKTMEYFASGVPALLYKLPGIPDEYYDYCYSLEEFSYSALAEKIAEILQLDAEVLREKGIRARQFILDNKNPKKQCKKIVDLIEGQNKLYYHV